MEAIRQKDSRGEIVIISDENYPAYCRCLISYYLAGVKKEEDLLLRPKSFYQKLNAQALLGKKATGVDVSKKKVVLDDKKEIAFDKLLIATGGNPKSIGVEGEVKKGVYKFRTIDDAKGLLELSKISKKALILGGGLIGLKAAYGLKAQGMDVEVIIKSDMVMGRVIDKASSEILRRHLEAQGIKIRTGLAAKEIVGRQKVEAAILDNDEECPCDIVVIGKGVAANTDVAKDSGINTHWGIVTNEYLETNIKDVFAAGDCAETFDCVLGETTVNALWTAASLQGRIAGLNMAGERKVYDGSIAENAVELYGLPIISLGVRKIPHDAGSQYQELVRVNAEKSLYKKIILRDNKLVGTILLGKFKNAGVYLALMRERVDVSSIKDLLLEDWFNFAKVKDLIPTTESKLSKSISIEGKFI